MAQSLGSLNKDALKSRWGTPLNIFASPEHECSSFSNGLKPRTGVVTNALSVAVNASLASQTRLPQSPGPAPQSGAMPNGKPTSPSPYGGERTQSPMAPNAQIAAQTVSSKDPKLAAQQASDMRNVVRRKLTGYVGFANLPNQWHRKSVRKGFNFNVMVVGKRLLMRKANSRTC